MQRIGIFSGTFNPLHAGHMAFALQAVQTCRLDQVVFLPEPNPRGKFNVPDVAIRLREIENQLINHPTLAVRQLTQPQFSVDYTLPLLQTLYPQSQLVLLIGSDVVLSLHKWPHIKTLTSSVEFAIGLRGSNDESSLVQYLASFDIDYTIIHTSYKHVSSSLLRKHT
jgi:nicotinate-nucleotide adenylyltransferase